MCKTVHFLYVYVSSIFYNFQNFIILEMAEVCFQNVDTNLHCRIIVLQLFCIELFFQNEIHILKFYLENFRELISRI